MVQNTKPEFSLFPWIFFLVSTGAWLVGKILLEIVTLSLHGVSDPSFDFYLIGMVAFPCLFANLVQGVLLKIRGIKLLLWLSLGLASLIVIAITANTDLLIILYSFVLIYQWIILKQNNDQVNLWVLYNCLIPCVLIAIHLATILTNPGFIIQDQRNLQLYGLMAVIFALTTTIAFNQLKSRT